MRAPTFKSYFCGGGLMVLGLVRAGLECVASREFCGSPAQQYRQIGNGVEIHMAEWIGPNLRRNFGQQRNEA